MVFNKRPGNKFPPNFVDHGQQQGNNHAPSRAVTGPIYSPSSQFGSNYNNQRHPSIDRNMEFNMRHEQEMTNRRPHLDPFNDIRSNEQASDLKGLGFWNDDNENKYDDNPNEETGQSSPIKFAIAVVALVIISSILWMVYRWSTQTQIEGIPHIRADESHYKVKSDNPGGVVFPHQEMLVYGRLSPQQQNNVQNENIMPPQEQYHFDQHQQPYENYDHMQENIQPQNFQQNYNQMQHAPMQPHQNIERTEYQNNPHYGQQVATQHQENISSTDLPNYQQNPQFNQNLVNHAPTNIAQNHQEVIPQQNFANTSAETTLEQQENHLQTPVQNENQALIQKEVVEPKEEAQKVATSAKSEDAVKNILPKLTEKQAKPVAQKTGYFVVIGSLPSSASAKSEWLRIKKKYQAELKDNNASIRQSEIGIKKVYKIFIGPFQEKNTALKRCLKIRNGCKVVHVKENKHYNLK